MTRANNSAGHPECELPDAAFAPRTDSSVPVICFAAGTLIATGGGERPIERLSVGDHVATLDNGPQPLRWIGCRTVRATGALAPVRILAKAMGNHSDLFVSPEHRMLCERTLARKLFATDAVLAPASRLVDDQIACIAYGGMVTYVHLMFDRHQVVFANGAPSESFHPAAFGLDGLLEPARQDFFCAFPALRADPSAYGPVARPHVSSLMAEQRISL